MGLPQTIENTSTESKQGLTSLEAAEQFAQFGPNDPAPPRSRSVVIHLLALFLNPLVIILLIAALASAFLGKDVAAGIIVTMVLLGGDQLRANVSLPTCCRAPA